MEEDEKDDEADSIFRGFETVEVKEGSSGVPSGFDDSSSRDSEEDEKEGQLAASLGDPMRAPQSSNPPKVLEAKAKPGPRPKV